jgi:excisionase family DNA binding protein
MFPADLMPVEEAARRLDVNSARVRAMLAAGRLAGDKVGGRWLVRDESIRRRQRERHGRGRQFSPANAWGLLFLASGQPAPWLSGSEGRRLLRLLDERGLEGLDGRVHQRASVHSFAAHPGVLRHLVEEPGLVLSGVSAASAHRLGLSGGESVDAYVPAAGLSGVVSKYALARPEGVPVNVKLRAVPNIIWPFKERVAPLAAVALDLAQEPDARSARIGLQALRQLDKRRRPASKG